MRIVVIGDVHASPEALYRIMLAIELIDDNLMWKASDTTLVFTGDICDRGHESASIYRNIMRWQQMAPSLGSSVIFIIGNHEVMNAAGYSAYTGRVELQGYLKDPESGEGGMTAAFSPGGWVYEWLTEQHFICRVGPFIIAHADFPCGFSGLTVEKLEQGSRNIFSRTMLDINTRLDEILWSRDASGTRRGYPVRLKHFLKCNNAEAWVCGHTPNLDGKITSRYDGSYICVDTAMMISPENAGALVLDEKGLRAAYTDVSGSPVYRPVIPV